MARRNSYGIDDYLDKGRRGLESFGNFVQSFDRETNKKRAMGPQGVSPYKRMSKPTRRPGGADSGVVIRPKNVQVTRTGLDRRKRTLDQRSTRGFGGRSRY